MSEEELAKEYEKAKQRAENARNNFIIEEIKARKWDHHS